MVQPETGPKAAPKGSFPLFSSIYLNALQINAVKDGVSTKKCCFTDGSISFLISKFYPGKDVNRGVGYVVTVRENEPWGKGIASARIMEDGSVPWSVSRLDKDKEDGFAPLRPIDEILMAVVLIARFCKIPNIPNRPFYYW